MAVDTGRARLHRRGRPAAGQLELGDHLLHEIAASPAGFAGASPGQVARGITLPLIRFGLLGSFLLVFMIFVREYSTAVYLLGPGSEVIGSLIVSLWATGAVDAVAALSVIDVVLVGAGLAVALRLGVRLHE